MRRYLAFLAVLLTATLILADEAKPDLPLVFSDDFEKGE